MLSLSLLVLTFIFSAENNDHYVYFSLLPLLAFALISWGMIAWSHWYDSPRDSAYAADIDPTDWVSHAFPPAMHQKHLPGFSSFFPLSVSLLFFQLEAVVAASQGGLRFAFEKDALQNSSGLQNARKVRVRLGQVSCFVLPTSPSFSASFFPDHRS